MKKILLFLILGICLQYVAMAQINTTVTVVGGSTWGSYGGDGLPATDASVVFFRTTGVAVDNAGNLYISDWGNARIRKVDAITGIVSTIAGNGTLGFSGDGGPATAAQINGMTYDMCLAHDNAGNLYIGDNGNYRIRKLNLASGIITTIAGNGSSVYSGDGGPATAAGIRPGYMYADATGVYFGHGHCVRKVDAATGLINKFAGNSFSTGGFSGDGGMATAASMNNIAGITGDGVGNIYIADRDNHRVRKVNAMGIISTIAGDGTVGSGGDGGLSSSATFNNPEALGVDAAGNLYIVDNSESALRKIDAVTNTISLVAGCYSGCSYSTHISTPVSCFSTRIDRQIAIDPLGNVYFTTYAGWVNKITLASSTCTGTPIAGAITAVPSMASCTTTFYVTGCSPGTTLQWQSSTDGSSWSNISGATFASYAIASSSAAMYYRCAVTCGSSGITAYTAAHHFTTVSPLYHHVYPSPDTVCNGQDFYVEACGTGSSYSVETFFGDATSSITPLTTTGVSNAHVYHQYLAGGIYTVKQVLRNGGSPIDSVTFTFPYTYCKRLPVRFYYDINGNCTRDGGDLANTQPVTVRVDSNGVPIDTIPCIAGLNYMAKGAPGTVYTFRILTLPTGLLPACPATGIWSETISSSVDNYPAKQVGLNCSSMAGYDFSVHSSIRYASHAGMADIYIQNAHCMPENATLTYNRNSKYNFSATSSNIAPSSVVGNTVKWDFASLSSYMTGPIHIHFGFGWPGPGLSPAGDTIHSQLVVTPETSDFIIPNNTDNRCDTVKYAFDPNDIAATPAGCFDVDTQFQFRIRFENDGNDTAHNIYVMDTLSDYLDPSTLQMVMSSHEMYVTKYREGGRTIVKFDFPNIKLLDSSHHGLCQGMLVYTIRNVAGMAMGATIQSRAGIYFDYNEVVMTNTAENKKGCPVPSGVAAVAGHAVTVYPNPAKDIVTIGADERVFSSVTITNMVGATLHQQSISEPTTTIGIKWLPAGVYMVTLKGAEASEVRRFVKW